MHWAANIFVPPFIRTLGCLDGIAHPKTSARAKAYPVARVRRGAIGPRCPVPATLTGDFQPCLVCVPVVITNFLGRFHLSNQIQEKLLRFFVLLSRSRWSPFGIVLELPSGSNAKVSRVLPSLKA